MQEVARNVLIGLIGAYGIKAYGKFKYLQGQCDQKKIDLVEINAYRTVIDCYKDMYGEINKEES